MAETLIIQELAERLAQAEETRRPIDPISAAHPELTLDSAYEIQRLTIGHRIEKGARLLGHKVGLTAQSMRDLIGVDEPDYGQLLDDMFEAESTVLALDKYIQPMVEIEPAFVLRDGLHGPGVTTADVLKATDHIVPCFEIIDSRIKDWRIGLIDTVADNGSSASVVLGTTHTRIGPEDIGSLQAKLAVNGETVASGNTADILGNPVDAIAWLANALGNHNVTLEAGQIVLAGSCIRAVPIRSGQSFVATFELLGTVEIGFE